MKNTAKIIRICFFVSLLLFLAQDSFALHFRVDKGKINVNLPPGWNDGGVITVDNMSGEPIDMRVYAGDWVYSDQDGSKNFLPVNSSPKSCAGWLKFYPADFTIPARGSQKVNYVVNVPQGAVGGYYAVLFFESSSGSTVDISSGAVVKVYNRIASLFYVEPEGTVERKAQINNVNVKRSADGIEIKADFLNTGNVDITSKGIFDIIDEEGVVFARGEFNEIYTMPQAQNSARLSAKSEDVNLTAGEYDLILTFDLGGDILVKECKIAVARDGSVTNIQETS